MDTVPKKVRSKIMAAIKPFGNKTTELAMDRLLSQNGLRGYRKHWPIAGKPDFAWPKLKIALFVDGCFWHGCPRCKRIPKSNVEFWTTRILGNRKRDRRVANSLRKEGWAVIRVWECSLAKERTIKRIRAALSALKVAPSKRGGTRDKT
jgi:DNA mismatch endonuclease (patch repair protein)